MDYKATWNEICFFMEKNRNASERDFQTTVEFLFEKLGWSQYKGEIISQEVIPVGSAHSVKPDIIIKNNQQNIFVVELKKPNATLSERNTEQLISYMRLLKLNFGILIGETLQIYYELPNDNKPPIKINEILFKKELETGAEFISIFGKNDFCNEKVINYCNKYLANIKIKEKTQEYLNLLCSNEGTELVKCLIKEKLLSEFSEEIVLKLVDKINIHISKKGNINNEPRDLPLFTQKPIVNKIEHISEEGITKNEAKILCMKNGIIFDGKITFASKNGTQDNYWANPYIGLLAYNWWLLLNDYLKQEIHVFKIPANSISVNQMKVRNDAHEKIDLKINYNDNSFEDNRSKIKFDQWFVKKISYKT